MIEAEWVTNSLREAIAIACEPADIDFHFIIEPRECYDVIMAKVLICGIEIEFWADSAADCSDDLQWRFCWQGQPGMSLLCLPAVLLLNLTDKLQSLHEQLAADQAAAAYRDVRMGALP